MADISIFKDLLESNGAPLRVHQTQSTKLKPRKVTIHLKKWQKKN